MINILILSAGTRDKVVQYFKEALAGKGKVIATDCSPYAPAIYEADEYVLVPWTKFLRSAGKNRSRAYFP